MVAPQFYTGCFSTIYTDRARRDLENERNRLQTLLKIITRPYVKIPLHSELFSYFVANNFLYLECFIYNVFQRTVF